MADDKLITVEVVYGTAERQSLITLQVPVGTRLQEAVRLSGIADQFQGVDLSQCKKGIFSRPVDDEQVLSAMDRIEIYRPLAVDPREARRRRAKKKPGSK